MPDCFVAYVTDLTASGARFETSQKFEFALALVTRRGIVSNNHDQ